MHEHVDHFSIVSIDFLCSPIRACVCVCVRARFVFWWTSSLSSFFSYFVQHNFRRWDVCPDEFITSTEFYHTPSHRCPYRNYFYCFLNVFRDRSKMSIDRNRVSRMQNAIPNRFVVSNLNWWKFLEQRAHGALKFIIKYSTFSYTQIHSHTMATLNSNAVTIPSLDENSDFCILLF